MATATQRKIRRKYDARAEFRATRRAGNENGSYRMECPARAGSVCALKTGGTHHQVRPGCEFLFDA